MMKMTHRWHLLSQRTLKQQGILRKSLIQTRINKSLSRLTKLMDQHPKHDGPTSSTGGGQMR